MRTEAEIREQRDRSAMVLGYVMRLIAARSGFEPPGLMAERDQMRAAFPELARYDAMPIAGLWGTRDAAAEMTGGLSWALGEEQP